MHEIHQEINGMKENEYYDIKLTWTERKCF